MNNWLTNNTKSAEIKEADKAQFSSQNPKNVSFLQIFERKVLLSISNGRKIFQCNIISSNIVAKSATQKRWVFLWWNSN